MNGEGQLPNAAAPTTGPTLERDSAPANLTIARDHMESCHGLLDQIDAVLTGEAPGPREALDGGGNVESLASDVRTHAGGLGLRLTQLAQRLGLNV